MRAYTMWLIATFTVFGRGSAFGEQRHPQPPTTDDITAAKTKLTKDPGSLGNNDIATLFYVATKGDLTPNEENSLATQIISLAGSIKVIAIKGKLTAKIRLDPTDHPIVWALTKSQGSMLTDEQKASVAKNLNNFQPTEEEKTGAKGKLTRGEALDADQREILFKLSEEGELTDAQEEKIAKEEIEASTPELLAEVKRKLANKEQLSRKENSQAMAMSLLGRLSSTEQDVFKNTMKDLAPTDAEKTASLQKLDGSQSLTDDDIKVLMYLKNAGTLSSDQATKLADSVLSKVSDAVKTEAKRKLASREKLSKEEIRVVMALSEKNQLQEKEKSNLEFAKDGGMEDPAQKRNSFTKSEEEKLGSKLTDGSITDEEITTIMEGNLPVGIKKKAAGHILKGATKANIDAVITAVKTHADVPSNLQKLEWALSMKRRLPAPERKTREMEEESAQSALNGLTAEQKNALKSNMMDGSQQLTTDDLMKLKTMKTLGELTETQVNALVMARAEQMNDAKKAELARAAFSGIATDEQKEEIAILMKANKASKDLKKAATEILGIPTNGETVCSVLFENGQLPTDMDFTDADTQVITKIGETFKEAGIDCKEMNMQDVKDLKKVYESMTDEQKTFWKNFKTSVSSVTREQIKHFPGKIVELLSVKVMKSMASAISDKLKKEMCQLAIKSTRTYKKTKEAFDCEGSFLDEAKDMDKSSKVKLQERLLDSLGDIEELSAEDIATFTKIGFTKDVLEKIPDNTFLADANAVKSAIDSGEEAEAKAKIKRAKPVDTMSKEDLKNTKGIRWNPSEIGAMNPDSVVGASKELMDSVPKEDLVVREKIVAIFRTKFPDPKTATADEIASMADTGVGEFTKTVLNAADDVKMKLVLQTATISNENQQRYYADRVKKMSEFTDPASITTANVDMIAPLLKAMGDDYVKKIPHDALAALVTAGKLAKEKLSKSAAKAVAAAALKDKDLSTISVTDVKNMGPSTMVNGVNADKLKDMPAAVFQDATVLADLEKYSDETTADWKDTINKKINEGKSPKWLHVFCGLGKMARSIPTADMVELDVQLIDNFIEMDGACNFDFTPSQLATCAELVVKKLGAVAKDNTKYLDNKNSLKQCYIGLTISQISKFPEGDDLLELVTWLRKSGKVSEKKMEAWNALVENHTKSKSIVTTTDVLDITTILLKLGYDKLKEKVPSSLCKVASKELRDNSEPTAPTTILTDHAKYIAECQRGSTSGTLTTEQAEEIGKMLCYHGFSDVENAAVKDVVFHVQECNPMMPESVRKTFLEKIKTSFAISAYNVITSEKFGAILGYLDQLTPSELGTIAKEVLSGSLDFVSELLTKNEGIINKRAYLRETGSDSAAGLAKQTEVMKVVITARVEQNSAPAVSRRRKRATGALTCSDIQALGTKAKDITVDQLNAITENEFINCVETLGTIVGWTAEQKTALATRLKEAGVNGPTLSGWTDAQVTTAGHILEGLTESELGQLAWTTTIIGNHGSSSTWTAAQRTAVVSKWLTDIKSNTVSDITGVELKSLEHIICGLTSTQISSVTSAAFGEASAVIGGVTGCSVEQMAALAAQAKIVYGAVNTWTTATIASLQNVVAGISGSELAGLSADHLAEIRPTTIAIVPADTFKYLTLSQLGAFSQDQALQVTAEQQTAMTEAQRTALIAAGGKLLIVIEDDNSAPESTKVYVVTFVTVLTAVLLYK